MGPFNAPFKEPSIPTTPSAVDPSPSGENTNGEQSETSEGSKGTPTTVANLLQPKKMPYIPKGMTLRQDRLNMCSKTTKPF